MYYRITEINFFNRVEKFALIPYFHNYGNMELHITLPQNTLLMRH